MDFLALDLETPNPKNDSICSIGLTLVKNSEIAWNRNQIIDPQAPFSAYNARIHGIDASRVTGAPTFAEFMAEHAVYFNHYPLVIHNAGFDMSVLLKAMRRDGIEVPPFDVYDTMSLCRLYYPNLDDHKLPTICDHLGIPLTHHDSGSDSLAAAKIMLTLLADEHAVIRTMSTLPTVTTEKMRERMSHARHAHTSSNPFSRSDVIAPENLIDPACDYSACPVCEDFAGKRFCITCCISDQKRIAEEKVVAIGGTLSKNMSKKVDFLIVGTQSKAVVTDPETGKTGKIIEAEAMIADGHRIKLIRMSDFLGGMLNG